MEGGRASRPEAARAGHEGAWARTNESAGDGVLQVVLFSVQRDDLAEGLGTALLAVVVLRHNPGPHFDLLPRLQHTTKNTPTGNTALQVVDLGPRFVHVERPDHDQPRR